jgi:hypothetical protein
VGGWVVDGLARKAERKSRWLWNRSKATARDGALTETPTAVSENDMRSFDQWQGEVSRVRSRRPVAPSVFSCHVQRITHVSISEASLNDGFKSSGEILRCI